ncbi:YadA-like family protein [Hafnia alvei]|nr:YadA-like family protein [Hafnia alvei]
MRKATQRRFCRHNNLTLLFLEITLMKTTSIAFFVATAVTASHAANATNTDVNNFIKLATAQGTPFTAVRDAYQNLNARDRLIVYETHSRAGISDGMYNDFSTDAPTAITPAGWNKEATLKQLHPLVSVAPAAPVTQPTQAQLKAQFAALKTAKLKADIEAKRGESRAAANVVRTASQHIAPLITADEQTARDNGQDLAINDAHATATQAMYKANSAYNYADTVHHEAMVIGADVDTNTANIKTNTSEIASVKTTLDDTTKTANLAETKATTALDVAYIANGKADQAQTAATTANDKADHAQVTANTATDKADHAQQSADHANVNANQALKNTFNLSSHIAANEQGIKANAAAIEQNGSNLETVAEYAKSNHDQINQAKATVTGIQKKEAIQNGSRVQGMIAAKHNAEQADTQQQIKNIVSSVSAQPDHATQITANRDGVAKNAAGVQKLTKQQRIDSVYYGEQIQNLATNTHSAIRSTQSRVSDNTASINKLNSNFSSLKNSVDDNRKEANAGIAGATAIASMPQVKSGDSFMVSAGAGTFNSESAVAVGASFNAGDHTVIKAGVSADTQSDFGAGVGIGFSY